ncbi:hypothetical protein KKD37_03565 [Patescibacteria group bacterium]|nr:hypothetical protein [Patescibacteria group bacterium]
MATIEQNFKIRPDGKIIFDGQELKPREGVTSATVPEKRKNHLINRQPRHYRGSYLTSQQSSDESYTTKLHIA